MDWRTIKKLLPGAFVLCVAFGVPLLGAIPPSVYFRTDDFVWLTRSSEASLRDALLPASIQQIPFLHNRPLYMLYWFVAYRLFGVSSAVPYVLVNGLFLAAGLLVLYAWARRRSLSPFSGVFAVMAWVVGFGALLACLLNAYNAGKWLNFLLIPTALWLWTSWARRPRGARHLYALALLVIAAAGFTRETALILVPLPFVVDLLASRRDTAGRLIGGTGGVLATCALVLIVERWSLGGFPLSSADWHAARMIQDLRFYLAYVMWDGPSRFLIAGALIASAWSRRWIAGTVLPLGVLVVGAFVPVIGTLALLLLLLRVSFGRGRSCGAMLGVWFLAAVFLPSIVPRRTQSYMLEVSFPWALLLATAAAPALERLPDRIGRRTRGAAIAVLAAMLVVGIGRGVRAYDQRFLPYKEHGRDFARANEFMVRALLPGATVYVLDNKTVYGKGMAGYVKRYRRFYVWTPDCWFTAFHRPDLEVFPWDRSRPMERRPAYLFTSNDYENAYFLESPNPPKHSVAYESPSCRVYRIGD